MISNEQEINLKFEFTAPYTPEQNGKIERKYATLYGKARAMLNWAKLTKVLRIQLWAQCAQTVTRLENILYNKAETKTASEKFYGKNPPWTQHLRTFGEIGIVHNGSKGHICGKLAD